jgi:hypothetical protein
MPFTEVRSVRELRDGRMIVADPRDRGLVVVDVQRGQLVVIGRGGQGPGEYSSLGLVCALGGDSSLVVDPSARRWLLLAEARIVRTIPSDDPAVQAARGRLVGVDTLGGVVTVIEPPVPPGTNVSDTGDSAVVIRVERLSGNTDTIAFLRQPITRTRSALASATQTKNILVYRHPLAVGEELIHFPDGWSAVIRLEPYRVDWRAPNGRWTRGKALPLKPVKLVDRERRAFMERLAARTGQSVSSPDVLLDWPETLPPFVSGASIPSRDGRLFVRREVTANDPRVLYDVINRSGELEGTLELPLHSRLVGFGKGSAILAVQDNSNLERLQFHPWNKQH